jgi:hypothetical protein
MGPSTREQIIKSLQQPFQFYIDHFGIDNIGIFEEEGQADLYYLGYTVTKNGKTYHIHTPYKKNDNGRLIHIDTEWTLETDDPQENDLQGYQNLESVFREIQ